MLAGTYNITCDQGSTYSLVITVKYPDTDDPTVYHPWDFTGYTARMQIRRTVESGTVLLELTTENGGLEFTDEDNGEITLTISATESAALDSSGVYDLEIVSDVGTVSKVIKGAFILNREVTR